VLAFSEKASRMPTLRPVDGQQNAWQAGIGSDPLGIVWTDGDFWYASRVGPRSPVARFADRDEALTYLRPCRH
jgi:hypothetical protein